MCRGLTYASFLADFGRFLGVGASGITEFNAHFLQEGGELAGLNRLGIQVDDKRVRAGFAGCVLFPLVRVHLDHCIGAATLQIQKLLDLRL